jgi:hypothetical protein
VSTNTERAREFLSSVQPPSLRYEIAHVAAFASELDAAERRGMERACRAMCWRCAADIPLNAQGRHYHTGSGDLGIDCHAKPIHPLMEPKP